MVDVKLPKRLHATLNHLCEQTQKTPEYYIRKAIEHLLEEEGERIACETSEELVMEKQETASCEEVKETIFDNQGNHKKKKHRKTKPR